MTWSFLLALAFMELVMKILALMAIRARGMRLSQLPSSPSTYLFFLSPVLTPESYTRSQPISALPQFLFRGGAFLGALLLCYWTYWQLVDAFHLHGIVLNYLCAVLVLFMSEVLAAGFTLLWLPGGRLLPSLHQNPWLARGVAEFWGRRWNLWMSDWFRSVIFQPLRHRPVLAVWLIFCLSGLLHECVLNLTLWLVTGRELFGTMMLYYLLQGAGVLLERRFLKRRPLANRFFTWIIVFVPVPLTFHEAMLRILHLWVE